MTPHSHDQGWPDYEDEGLDGRDLDPGGQQLQYADDDSGGGIRRLQYADDDSADAEGEVEPGAGRGTGAEKAYQVIRADGATSYVFRDPAPALQHASRPGGPLLGKPYTPTPEILKPYSSPRGLRRLTYCMPIAS